jgi:allantoate deiminase
MSCVTSIPDISLALARRVLERADELAVFTEEPGRITRPLASPALAAATERVSEWMQAAGLATRSDALGNLVGRREGGRVAGTLVFGSHLDSVADAGRYDGVLGVLVGIACVEALGDTKAALTVEVAAFADEEGMRFRSSYLGSRAFTGRLDARDMALRDADGVTLEEAIGGELGPALAPPDLHAYFEVHIEQGPVLESAGVALGIVTGIVGQSRFALAFDGQAGHAGTTPMDLRRDALAAAAELVLAAERIARNEPGLVATVGDLRVPHGAANVIPGRAEATLDVRHASDAVRARVLAALRAETDAIGARRGVRVSWAPIAEHCATPCTPKLTRRLARAVGRTGTPLLELTSGAGHDAVAMAEVTAIAMLFVRCAGGISHHPAESVALEDVALAIRAATEFLR